MKSTIPVTEVSLLCSRSGLAMLLCLVALMTGCAGPGDVRPAQSVGDTHNNSGTAKESKNDDGDKARPAELADNSISFFENRSVDKAVREDFDTALGLLQDKKYPEAIRLLQKVIQKTQNSAPYINIALAYEMTGEMGLAEDNLKRALEFNPNHPATMNEYALLYRRTGRFAEAKKMYESVLLKYPSFLPARKNFGVLCELYLNDLRCALEEYEAYSKALPDDEEVKLWIIGLKQKTGG